MTDTIIAIFGIIFCIIMGTFVCILLHDLIVDIKEERRAAKRRKELIKKLHNMKLDKPYIYIDTDAEYYRGGYTHTMHTTWGNMRVACRHFNNTSSVNRCVYPDNDNVQHCNYYTCPLLHAEIDK